MKLCNQVQSGRAIEIF